MLEVEADLQSILEIRKIRNSCRKYLTNNQKYIGLEKQLDWYSKVFIPRYMKGLMRLFLFFNMDNPVGYGVINIVKGKEWVTGGLIPGYRNKGFGKELFENLIAECKKTVYLEVLKSNKRAVNTYLKIGFKPIEKKSRKILIMKYEK